MIQMVPLEDTPWWSVRHCHGSIPVIMIIDLLRNFLLTLRFVCPLVELSFCFSTSELEWDVMAFTEQEITVLTGTETRQF